MLPSVRLIKAARVLLAWSQKDLAERAGLAPTHVSRIEAGRVDPKGATLAALQRVLEENGIVFLAADREHGDGVRYASPRQAETAGPPKPRPGR